MIIINLRNTTHNFEKQNMFTLVDKGGSYDLYKCKLCGLEGKRRTPETISVKKTASRSTENCPNAKKAKRIRIVECRANGRQFTNLTPGSEHDVVDAPEGVPNNLAGVWVMGVGEPVKVLVDEYEEVE